MAEVTPELIQKLEDWVNSTLADPGVRVCLHADRTVTVRPDGRVLRECDYCPAWNTLPAGAVPGPFAAYYYEDRVLTGFEAAPV